MSCGVGFAEPRLACFLLLATIDKELCLVKDAVFVRVASLEALVPFGIQLSCLLRVSPHRHLRCAFFLGEGLVELGAKDLNHG